MIDLTRADFSRFAPNAKPQYVDALFNNIGLLREAGVLDSKERWCHFIGQCASCRYCELISVEWKAPTQAATRGLGGSIACAG